MNEKMKEKLQDKQIGKVIPSPVDGPDIVLPEMPKPEPKDPDPCGNGRKPVLPKPPKKKPLDPRLERDKIKR